MAEDEKNKIQREVLMEKIRNSQHKSFPETAKAVRMSMLEKRYQLDPVEKSIIRKCLDSLTHSIKVTTRTGLCERLETLSRHLGLKFMEDSNGLFISSDMFYLEIILDANGSLKDVKVHHECKIEQSETELVQCLQEGDFTDFTMQLEGLSSIYQLNAEPKIKSKAFVALQAVENDLYNLFQWQSFNKDVASILVESPVGVVQKRRGGHAMKLIFFVPPYDLLVIETNSMLPLTLDSLSKTKKDIGLYVTVNLEASSSNILQIVPIVNFSKETNYPSYSSLSSSNSILFPATFVLRLNKPLPVCSTLLPSMGISSTESLESGNILNLSVQAASKSALQNYVKGLYVTLPDQHHCYFFMKNKDFTGSLISSIPFTEPAQVPKIVTALKQQGLFYTLLCSCIRGESKMTGFEAATILEVNAISIYTISVSLQHPYEESLAAVEFDLTNLSNLDVKIYSLSNTSHNVHNKILTKIARTSLSIPITIRYLLKLWDQEEEETQEKKKKEIEKLKENNSKNNGNYDISGYDRHGSIDYRNKDRNNTDNSSGFGPNSKAQFFPSGITNATNHFQLKNELREFPLTTGGSREDFCKSPKSDINFKLNNLNTFNFLDQHSDSSLGDLTKQSSNVTCNIKSLTIERINKKDSSDLWDRSNDNIVSITPISALASSSSSKSEFQSTVNGIKMEQNQQQQKHPQVQSQTTQQQQQQPHRSNIEIIPLLNKVQTSISIMPVNASGSGSNSSSSTKSSHSSSKKKNEEKDPNKVEKKRRKKEHSSSGDVKVTDISSKLPSTNSSAKNNKLSISPNVRKVNSKNSTSSKMSSTSVKQSPLLNKHSNTLSSSGGKPNITTLKNTTSGNLLLNEQKFKSIPKEKPSSCLDSSSMKKLPQKDFTKNIEDHYIFDDSDFADNIDFFDSRKNSINAVIDKLKAQNNDFELSIFDTPSKSFEENSEKTKFNSEYMIKPSSDGMKMKLTISSPSHSSSSSTSSKVSCSPKRPSASPSHSNSNPGNVSPNKKHTGLKPGVSAGPASKKSTSTIPSKSDMKASSSGSSMFYKSASSESLPKSSSSNFGLSKSLSSHSLNLASFRKDQKNYSNKSKLNSGASVRPDSADLMKILQFSSGKSALEGFQIPKLSAKNSASSSTSNSDDLHSIKKPQINPMSHSVLSSAKSDNMSMNLSSISNLPDEFKRKDNFTSDINSKNFHNTIKPSSINSDNLKNQLLQGGSNMDMGNISNINSNISKSIPIDKSYMKIETATSSHHSNLSKNGEFQLHTNLDTLDLNKKIATSTATNILQQQQQLMSTSMPNQQKPHNIFNSGVQNILKAPTPPAPPPPPPPPPPADDSLVGIGK